MNAESDPLRIMPVAPDTGSQVATTEEIEAGLRALTNEDYVKLMMIARSFCKKRRLSNGAMEPEELLSEAIAKTFQPDGKKWYKRVSLVKHLDRAMENISGHLVRQRKKVDAFPDGLEPSVEQRGPHPVEAGADETIMLEEELQEHLLAVFGEDAEASKVFTLRALGFRASDIQTKLTMTAARYETVAKRIRRKISLYLNQKPIS